MDNDTPQDSATARMRRKDPGVFLETLFGDIDKGFVSISIKPLDGPWRDNYITAPVDDLDPLIRRLGNVEPDVDVYATVAPRKTETRGTAANTLSLTSLWIELDSAGSSDGKQQNPGLYFATLEEAKTFVNSAAPWKPTMIVDSGHGWHFYWVISEAVTEGIEELLAAWRGCWEAKALAAGKRLDPVFDSARVMRVPGTWNMKGVPIEVSVVHIDVDARYGTSEILDFIPPEERRRASTYASALAEPSEIENWIQARSNGWNEQGRAFVHGLLEEMKTASERHPTAKKLLASLLQSNRAGVDYGEAIESLGSEFEHRVSGERRSAREFDDLVMWVVSQRLAEDTMRVISGNHGVADERAPSANSPGALDGDKGRLLHLVPASEVMVEAVAWLEPNLWPIGFLSVLAGIGGLGKSTYTYRLAADVTRGTTAGHWAGTSRSVIVFSAEDTWKNVIKPRLIAVKADLDRCLFVAASTDPDGPASIDIPDDLIDLERIIKERGDVALIVFDPLVAYLGDGTDTHRDHSTRRALKPLGDFAATTGAAVIGVMHLNKSSGATLYSRLSMSVAFYNAVRTAVLFAEDPDNPESAYRILAQDKNNLAQKPVPTRWLVEPVTITEDGVSVETSKLSLVGEADVDVRSLLLGPNVEDAPKAEIAREAIEQLWAEHRRPVSVGDVCKRIDQINEAQPTKADGISYRTFQRALKMLGGTSRREGFGGDSEVKWVPPEGYFQA